MFKLKKDKTRGFTLIELLVVIAIIGILATIVMVSLNSARTKARDVRRLSDMQQVQLAMEMYRDATGGYPNPGTYNFTNAVALLVPTYLGVAPVDPGSNTYTALAGSATQYCFYVQLENPATNYAVSSETGAGKRNAVPAALGSCGPNTN